MFCYTSNTGLLLGTTFRPPMWNPLTAFCVVSCGMSMWNSRMRCCTSIWNPLESRRDIAMVGLIHRTILGEGPSQFRQWFQLYDSTLLWSSARRHRNTSRNLKTCDATRLCLGKRFVFGHIDIYNVLPNDIVLQKNVPSFQSALTQLPKEAAQSGFFGWPNLFSPRCALTSHPLRRFNR